jgi:hypothetical protein
MTDDAARRIADAVLYEGYVLWPYRRSALKNQRRWTFGGIYPESWSAAAPDDPWRAQTQCLLEGADPAVEVRVRFLHVVERVVRDANGERVDELEVEGARWLSWDEAIEREVGPGAIDVEADSGTEQLPARAGTVVRSWEPLRGRVALSVEPVADAVQRVTVTVENTTPIEGGDREHALRRSFCSTHAVLRAERGRFASLTDPPPDLAQAAQSCENVGTWPVLVGDEGDRQTMLSSPIILPDYPQVAPESPGDLFDATEIDELLVLNVLALTDEERAEVRASDPRARELLDRCASLSEEQLMRLHGAVRELR